MKRMKILLPAAVLLLLFAAWMLWGNFAVTVTEYRAESEKLPDAFSGFRIAQISDLHNAEFGEGNRRLLNKLEKLSPDLIVITGDLVDSSRTDESVAIEFCREAVRIAPVYYVTGNHEARGDESYRVLREGLLSVGVTVLENQSVILEREGEQIALIGVQDPAFSGITAREECQAYTLTVLMRLAERERYDVVLCHRPLELDTCGAGNADLLLCGHLHGGQFRLPFLGGVYAPSQGLFPEYDGGMYTEGDGTMIVSRGLGNSRFPIRLNNPPEIVLTVLSGK